MKLVEYQIILPFTVEEYRIAQLYCVAKMSMEETMKLLELGKPDGVEVLKNEQVHNDAGFYKNQFHDAVYTHKMFYLYNKLAIPGWLKPLVKRYQDLLTFEEKAYNAYPYCLTTSRNLRYKDFETTTTSLHSTYDKNSGLLENIFETKDKYDIVKIDIGDAFDDPKCPNPCTYKFKNECHHNLSGKEWWRAYNGPLMCAYKRVKAVGGVGSLLNGYIEDYVQNQARRLFTNFHRQLFCWQDSWKGMTMAQLRDYESEVKHILDERRRNGPASGMTVSD